MIAMSRLKKYMAERSLKRQIKRMARRAFYEAQERLPGYSDYIIAEKVAESMTEYLNEIDTSGDWTVTVRAERLKTGEIC